MNWILFTTPVFHVSCLLSWNFEICLPLICQLWALHVVIQELCSSWDGRPFGRNRHGSKRGVCCVPFRGRGLGRIKHNVARDQRYTSVPSGILIHPAVWHNRHGPKIGGCCAPFYGELGPHLTQCGLGRGPPPKWHHDPCR